MISLMEIDGGFCYDEDDRKNPTFYQKVSALKQRHLSRNMDFAKVEMNKHI